MTAPVRKKKAPKAAKVPKAKWEPLEEAALDSLLGSGRTAEVYRLRSGETIKLFLQSVTQRRAVRELTNSQWAAAAGLPVWQTSRLVRCGKRWGIIGRPLPPSTISLTALLLKRPWEAERWFEAFVDLHARINAAAAPELPAIKSLLASRIKASGLPPAERDAVLAQLKSLPGGKRLCHGDLHPGNTMVTDDGLVAVDWSSAGRGPLAFDVARTAFLLSDGIGRAGTVGRLLRSSALYYARRYQELRLADSGVAPEAVAAWRLPVLAARLVRRNDSDRSRLLALLRDELQRLGWDQGEAAVLQAGSPVI